MHKLYPSGGHIILEADGVITWGTDRRPINLLPESSWIDYAASINFPDFDHYNAYYLGDSGQQSSGFEIGQCASFVTVRGGEYGPGAGGGKALAETIIGTVPVGVNALEVYVELTRTVNPSNYLSFAIDNLVPANQMVYLPGGSCIVERAPGGKWTRGFEVVLVGQNIVLRRYQSVWMGDADTPDWRADNDTGSAFLSFLGWTYANKNGNSGMTGGQGKHTFIVQAIQGRVGTANIHRGGSSGCSLTDNTNYSATWTGTIHIRPGIVGPGVTSNVRSKIKHTGLLGMYVNGPTATFDALWTDRAHTIIAVTAHRGPAASSSRSISSVTVNGLPATQLVLRAGFLDSGSSDQNLISGIYIIDTPASHLASVVVNFSNDITEASISMWACDQLNSFTPDATFATGGTGSQSLATVNGGVMVFSEVSLDRPLTITGIADGFARSITSIGTEPISVGYGFQNTNGSTMSIDPTAGSTSNWQAAVAVSLH